MSNKRINNGKCVKPLEQYSYLSGKLKDKKDYERYYKWLSEVNLNENICTSLTALSKEAEIKNIWNDSEDNNIEIIMNNLIRDINVDIDERRKTIFYKYMTIKRLKNKLDTYMKEIEKYKYSEDSDQYKETIKIMDNIIYYFGCIDNYVKDLKERIDDYNYAIDIYSDILDSKYLTKEQIESHNKD